MLSSKKNIAIIFILLRLIVCIVGQKKFADLYYMKNHVLALSEELKIDALVEDLYFTGGKDVLHWLKLPSVSVLYLVGIKEAGLSLISVTKKLSNPFYQAVEQQIDENDLITQIFFNLDIGENISSTIAFKSINSHLKKVDNIVMTTTESAKQEIIFYKIQNYKLVRFWSWKRYAKVQSLLHFTVMGEDRIIILDSDGITAYLYKFSIDNDSVHVRELEVFNFQDWPVKMFVSILFPQPYLYVLENGKLGVYKYTRFCSESWAGEFMKQMSIENFGITDVTPFQSNGREYLALSGKLGGILRVDTSEKIIQELEIENVDEWLVIHTGPERENTLLFCKTLAKEIKIFYNTGSGWKVHANPSCYKFDKEQNKRIETDIDLDCLKDRKWAGALSLELGQLPTLIFSQRKFFGEMYHIMVSVKRHILSMDEMPGEAMDHWNYLSKMRSNLKNIVGDINTKKVAESTCNIVNMLTEIENIAANAKEKVLYSCPAQVTSYDKRVDSFHDVIKSEQALEWNKVEGKTQKGNDGISKKQSLKTKVFYSNIHPISPDMEVKSSSFQEYVPAVSISGFPKKQDDII